VSLKDKEDTEHTEIDEVAKEAKLLWSRVVTEGASKSDCNGKSEVPSLLRSGPVYKADVTIDGVKSQALLDHRSQITIVQRQMLPLVKEKHGWSLEICLNKLKPLESFPTGAFGQKLNAKGIVMMNIRVKSTEKTCNIPCYILDSEEPLWSGVTHLSPLTHCHPKQT